MVTYQESLSARGFPVNQSPSEFVIVATENGTNASFISKCASVGGTAAGTSISLTLNQGQAYQYQCGNQGDVTGTRITSDRPIGVVAGNACADVPVGTAACDVLSEMMFPVASLFGNEFYSAPLPGSAPDLFRIMASRDGTTVTVNQGASEQTYNLNQGQFQELRFKASARFTSNLPILVNQYAVGFNAAGLGDPFQMQLLPLPYRNSTVRFNSPTGFTQTLAIVVAPNSAVSSVTLNGSPVTGFQPLPGGTHQYVVVTVPAGQSIINASQPISVSSVGFVQFGSYGSPVGP